MSATAMVPASEQAKSLRSFIDTPSVIGELVKVLPKHLTPERMIRQTLTLCSKNPKLLGCSGVSILGGLIQAAELGLEMSGPLGHAYLVPRWNKHKKCTEATFQVGYRGFLDLVFRGGKVTSFPMRVVHAADIFEVKYGSHQWIRHEPQIWRGEQTGDQGRGEVIGYYAVGNFAGGGSDFEFMSHPEMVEFRKKYASDNPIWDSAWNEMSMKTVARRLCKRLPMSVDAQMGAVIDEINEQSPFDSAAKRNAGASKSDLIADRLDAIADAEIEQPDQAAN